MRKLIPFCLLFSLAASAQNLPANYEQLVKEQSPKVVEWRRYFHQFPELSNREFNTAKKIEATLKQDRKSVV